MLPAYSMMGDEVLGVEGGGKCAEREKKREDEGSDACPWLILKLWVVS